MGFAGYHHTEKAKEKISLAKKGHKLSDAHKEKLSIAHKGKHLSNEHKANISARKKGKHLSAEARAKISSAMSGAKNHNYGMTGENATFYGRNHTERTREKLSAINLGRCISNEARMKISIAMRGENHPSWKGGISFEPYCPKFDKNLKKRVRAFFEYTCILCGKTEKDNSRCLSVHHVEYDKQACCHDTVVTFAALCTCCHAKTSNGDRGRWEAMIHRIIDEIYGGRSYFTEEELGAL